MSGRVEKFRELAEWRGQVCLRLQSTRDCCRNKVMLPEYSAIKFEPARGERCNKSSKFEMPSLTGSAGERPGRPGSPGRWGIATK